MLKPMSNFLFAIALICGCSLQGPDITGTSEQGNARVIATVYTSTGVPAENAIVRLRRVIWIYLCEVRNDTSRYLFVDWIKLSYMNQRNDDALVLSGK
jgi:hypothetical protein